MKNIIMAAALCCSCITAAANASTNDVSDVLDVTGTVRDVNAGCVVELDRSYMRLDSQAIDDLPMQGLYKDTVSGTINVIRLSGSNCKNNSGGSIAIRFTGDADDAAGTSFANTSSGSAAAQGIGIAVYGYGKNTIIPNTSEVPTFNEQYLFYVGMVKLKNMTPTPGLVASTITVKVDRL